MQTIPQVIRITNIPEAEEPLYFHLRSGEYDFSLLFIDIVACVRYAQEHKFIRHVQEDYWVQMEVFFPGLTEKINVSANTFPLGVVDGDGDEYMYFPLQSDNHKFTIGLSHILMCLKLAEEEGSIPLLSKDSWYELENFYHELIDMRVFGFDKEI